MVADPLALVELGKRTALILPKYALSISSLLVHVPILPAKVVRLVGMCALGGVYAAHAAHVAICDLKPANMCLTAEENPRCVLIDFVGAALFNSISREEVEHTELYAMDAPLAASVELDMTCLAASMYQISSSNSEPPFTRSALRQRMQTQLGEDTDMGEGESEREEEDEDESGEGFVEEFILACLQPDATSQAVYKIVIHLLPLLEQQDIMTWWPGDVI
jgi:serine/threonine protein kinase